MGLMLTNGGVHMGTVAVAATHCEQAFSRNAKLALSRMHQSITQEISGLILSGRIFS